MYDYFSPIWTYTRERTVTDLVTSRLSKLSDIWEKMGLDSGALAVRHETVAKVVEKQLQEMIDEEEKWMAREAVIRNTFGLSLELMECMKHCSDHAQDQAKIDLFTWTSGLSRTSRRT